MHTATRVPKGERLFAGGHIKAHQQLPHSVDVEDISQIGQAGGLAELTLTYSETHQDLSDK